MPTIKKPNSHFDVVLWTGNGANRNITGINFSPDFVIGQARNAVYGNWWFDSVRGATKQIASFGTNAESTQSTMVTAFNSDGFSLGTDTAGNNSGTNFVAWVWRGSDSAAVVNTSGTISSNVSVNTTAGFSIVTYTGNATNGATVGHGLGVAPSMVIVKNRTTAGGNGNLPVYHASLGATKYLHLNETIAAATSASRWNDTAPSSTVITIGNTGTVNDSSNNYVAYCFAEVEGFSKFGSYTGNGSTDGPFVFTNFLPRFVLIKQSSSAGNNWQLIDIVRETTNPNDTVLFPNVTTVEGTGNATLDFLSNGFKVRTADGTVNTSTSTYIYAAFAESPFKYSNAK